MHICQSQIQDIMPSFAYSRYKALCPSSFILLKSRNDIGQLTFLTAVQFKHTCLTLINDLVLWRGLFCSQCLPFVSFKVVLKISNLVFFKRDLVMYDIYCYQRSNKTNVTFLKIRIDENFKRSIICSQSILARYNCTRNQQLRTWITETSEGLKRENSLQFYLYLYILEDSRT